MTPIKSNLAPLTKRINALAITAAAALSFALTSPSAHAAHVPVKPTKEYQALVTNLPATATSVETASAADLQKAVEDAIANNPGLKPGNIAGEALKHSTDLDAGDEVAAALGSDLLAARDAIKRAGKGKDLNVSLVPGFAAALVDSDTEALNLAKLVKASKPGAGAVIGGRASELADDAARLNLVNAALVKTAGLTAAAQDIVKFVVAEVDGDTAAFTADLAVLNATNIKLAAKIGAGSVAGDPTNGGAIVDALLNKPALPKLKSGIAGFVKAVANVADIEEMSKIAIAVGNQMAVPAGKSTAIKFAKATGIVKTLAKAIVAKSTSEDPIRNRTENKTDEIGEVVAYIVATGVNTAVVNGTGGGKPQLANAKVAAAKILAIIKAAISATKGAKVAAAEGSTFLVDTALDVFGSVGETLGQMKQNSGLSLDFDTLSTLLVTKAGTLAGKNNAAALSTAFNEAYDPDVDIKFEDGTIAGNAQTSDPETDFRGL